MKLLVGEEASAAYSSLPLRDASLQQIELQPQDKSSVVKALPLTQAVPESSEREILHNPFLLLNYT